jgi:PAS domain S-box-containing protein
MNKLVIKEKTESGNRGQKKEAFPGTLIINERGKIIYCNDRFIQLIGFSTAQKIINTALSLYLFDKEGNTIDFSQISKIDLDKHAIFSIIDINKNPVQCNGSIRLIHSEKEKLYIVDIENINGKRKIRPLKEMKEGLTIQHLEKKLEKCEEKFRKISELSSSPICIQTIEKFIFVNLAWEKLTGYSKAETASLNSTSLIHSDFSKLIKNRFKAKLEGKKVPEKFDMKLLSKSGKEIWVSTDFSLIEYEGEHAIMTVFTDITEMKKTQQALKSTKKKFQSLFYENTSIMILVDPKNGNIVDANEAACKFYGYPKSKIISLNMKEISTSPQEEIEAEMDDSMKDKRKHFFYQHRLSNDEIRDVEIYSGKVEMKEGVYLYSTVHDITARKKAEEALKKSEQELKQINAQKDRFFSIIAHDLRSPIATYMQLTEFMRKNYSTLDDADFEKYFNHLYASISGTYKLLENLLTWARSQVGVIELKPELINIRQFSEETISILNESANSKKIEILNKVPKELEAFADKNTIATVLRNLLNNAIRFTNTEGLIQINARKIENNNEKGKSFIEISIKDNGIGIQKENIDKLFRIESSYSTRDTKNEKGTGLGLILCKELVNKNGGEIWVESEANQGSTFSFSLLEQENSSENDSI